MISKQNLEILKQLAEIRDCSIHWYSEYNIALDEAIRELEVNKLEEDEEIDIQSIEDLKYETIIEILGECDCWKGNELYCLKTFSKNDENLLKSNAENHKKINELIKAIKQLDKKIKEKEND